MPSSKDPAINRLKAKEWRLKNPDRHREANRIWMAEKRTRNPEWAKEQGAKWRSGLTDEQRAARAKKAKEWREKHPGYQKDWNEKNRGGDPLRTILNQAKIRARKLGLPFDLTRENISVPELCPVLGTLIDYKARGAFNPNSPSVDRLIPSLGYVASNCRVISNRANILKRDATLEEVEAIAAYMRREIVGW